MDFSLSRAPADQLHVGTRPYLDPFLDPQFGRKRWDLASDRFAAAMVLHEMAAGTLPYWGSRNTDPRFTDAEVSVDRDASRKKSPSHSPSCSSARSDAKRRSGSTRPTTWSAHGSGSSKHSTSPPRMPKRNSTRVLQRAKATRETPVVALGLSARAVNALDRESALTVADFLALSPLAINSMRGVGVETRRELVDAHRELRHRLGEHTDTTTTTTTDEPDDGRLDAVVAKADSASNDAERNGGRCHLEPTRARRAADGRPVAESDGSSRGAWCHAWSGRPDHPGSTRALAQAHRGHRAPR